MAETTRFWGKYYKTLAEQYDKELLDGWNTNLDVIQVFAALFSSINSAFIIQSNADLRSDPNDDITNLLRVVINRLDNSSFPEASLQSSNFKPSSWAVRVNIWFFTSLSCSLLAAFGAVLAKQWLLDYSRQGQIGSPEVRGRTRHHKFLGLQQWHVSLIIDVLPSLLQISLLVFFIGLIDFLWPLSKAVACVVLAFAVVGVLLQAVTSGIALAFPQSPFQTPSVALARTVIQTFTSWFSLFDSFTKPSNPYLLSRENYVLDAQAMSWVIAQSVDEMAIQTASLATLTIPRPSASKAFLQDNIERAVLRLLTVAHNNALVCTSNSTVGTEAASGSKNVVSSENALAPLRALYHVLTPLVLDIERWDTLKRNGEFQLACADAFTQLKKSLLTPEASDLLWMIEFCIGALDKVSPDELMESMDARLDRIVFSKDETGSKTASLEALVEHAAFLIHVLDIDVNRPRSPAYGVRFQISRVLSYSSNSQLPPSVSLWNAIVVATIPRSRQWTDEESIQDSITIARADPSLLTDIQGDMLLRNRPETLGDNLYAAIRHEVSTPCDSIGPAIDRLTPVLRLLNLMTSTGQFRLSRRPRRKIAQILLLLLRCWPMEDLHRSHAFVEVAEFFDDADTFDMIPSLWHEVFRTQTDWRIHLVKFACIQLLSYHSTSTSRRFGLKVLSWHLDPRTSEEYPDTSRELIWSSEGELYSTVPSRICSELKDRDNRGMALRCLELGMPTWFTGDMGQTFTRECIESQLSISLLNCVNDRQGDAEGIPATALHVVVGIIDLRAEDSLATQTELASTFLTVEWVSTLSDSLTRGYVADTMADISRRCLSSLWSFAPANSTVQEAFLSDSFISRLTDHLLKMTEYCGRAYWLRTWLWAPLEVSCAWYQPISIIDAFSSAALERFILQTGQLCNLIQMVLTASHEIHPTLQFVEALKLFFASFRDQVLHPFESDTARNPRDWGTVVKDNYVRDLIENIRPSFKYELPTNIERVFELIYSCRAILLDHIEDVLNRVDFLIQSSRNAMTPTWEEDKDRRGDTIAEAGEKLELEVLGGASVSSSPESLPPSCPSEPTFPEMDTGSRIEQFRALTEELLQLIELERGTGNANIEKGYWERHSFQDRIDRMRRNLDRRSSL